MQSTAGEEASGAEVHRAPEPVHPRRVDMGEAFVLIGVDVVLVDPSEALRKLHVGELRGHRGVQQVAERSLCRLRIVGEHVTVQGENHLSVRHDA